MKNLLNTSFNANLLSFWLLLLRIAIGILMLTHGWPKFQSLMAGNVQFADPIGIGQTASLVLTVFAEVFCSILLIIGFATRFATIPLIILTAVAAFIVHAKDALDKKELALLYLLIYITLLIAGSGRYAIDSQIGKKRYR